MRSNKKVRCSICKREVSRRVLSGDNIYCMSCSKMALKKSDYKKKLLLSSIFFSGARAFNRG